MFQNWRQGSGDSPNCPSCANTALFSSLAAWTCEQESMQDAVTSCGRRYLDVVDDPGSAGLYKYFTFMLLLLGMVPISLYVTLEVPPLSAPCWHTSSYWAWLMSCIAPALLAMLCVRRPCSCAPAWPLCSVILHLLALLAAR